MGEYYLLPEPRGTLFSADALADMHTWLAAKPTYRRRDGAIILCRDYEYRDSILRNRAEEDLTASA
jgi:hypothetical protein